MDYEFIKDRQFLPRHLRVSTLVVKATYGKLGQPTAHTETVFFGQITLSLIPEISYLWMLDVPSSSLGALRSARRLWRSLRHYFSPVLYAHASTERDVAFLLFLGFTKLSELDGVTYFQELTDGH